MAEMVKNKSDVKDVETTSTVEETCFVDIQKDEIKLVITVVQGKFYFNRNCELKNVTVSIL